MPLAGFKLVNLGKAYLRVFVEVINPAPQEKCITEIIGTNKKYSLMFFAKTTDANNKKVKYVAAGIRNIGLTAIPKIMEVTVVKRAVGGARYQRLMVPVWLRETTRRQRPYSKYCLASFLRVGRGR